VPNGHGGIPRFGSPVLLSIGLALLLWLRISGGATWTIAAAYPLACLLAWRFS
jgi:hypothetical protein